MRPSMSSKAIRASSHRCPDLYPPAAMTTSRDPSETDTLNQTDKWRGGSHKPRARTQEDRPVPEQTLSKQDPRRDQRAWENDPKLGGRLRRQVGSDLYKSEVPNPERPGRGKVRHFHASGWTEARKLHAARVVKVDNGLEAKSSKQRLDDLAEERWSILGGLVESGARAPTTLETDKALYRLYIGPRLGRMQLRAISPERISKMLAELRQAGFKSSAIRRIYSVLRSLLNLAVTRGLIPESPLKRLDSSERPESGGEAPGRVLTDEECSRLIRSTAPSQHALTAFYAFTAVRQSEGLAVRWGDLDLTEGVASINAQLSRPKRGKPSQRVPLKTARKGCREREVELHPDLVGLLKRHKADAFARGLAGSGDLVFCTRAGRPFQQRNVARDLATAAERAKLNTDGAEPVSTHDLRHTAISRWIAAGIDPATVARMAGDSLPTILKTYAHEFDRARNREANRAKLAEGTSISL
jgi:integrase